ncbi:MAG TPA: UDP-N-acetylmuramate dehydrogenase, partial [Aggregatilinea sp.]|uniref:UDP-N-acetylmuramate dehydrogenase n=1 Tax=Aggregatilinea sp. TaxID=2806333 RepID=UPI002CA65439
DWLLTARSRADLVDAVRIAQAADLPWLVLGGGANVLAADAGVRGLVIVNHAKDFTIDDDGRVLSDSGMSLSTLGRRCMSRGLAGLEWAVNVPGTVGGAVVNNAGAHGGDMAEIVRTVEVLDAADLSVATWDVARMDYAYRHSALKGTRGRYVVLGAALTLEPGHDPAALNARADGFVAHRKQTQPPGASLGSIFKNPPGDYAGRLIEAAGLKGYAIGGVQISPVHANFFVHTGHGTASDYRALIEHARAVVLAQFGVTLETEIECLGDW